MRIRDEQLEKHKKELHFFIACNSYVSCHLSYFSYQYHVRKYIFSLHAIVMFLVIYRISRTNIMFANTLYCNC
jgi:hypothetical protein